MSPPGYLVRNACIRSASFWTAENAPLIELKIPWMKRAIRPWLPMVFNWSIERILSGVDWGSTLLIPSFLIRFSIFSAMNWMIFASAPPIRLVIALNLKKLTIPSDDAAAAAAAALGAAASRVCAPGGGGAAGAGMTKRMVTGPLP